MTHSNLSPVQIADRLNGLARKCSALRAAIRGHLPDSIDHEETSGMEDPAWEIREELGKLSDEVLANGRAELKAVAP